MSIKFHVLKTAALAAGIVIVLNLFFHFGVQTFYPAPKYEDFCPQKQINPVYDRTACESVGGQWNERYSPRKIPAPQYQAIESVPEGYCDPFFTCGKEYRGVEELYQRNVFVVLLVAGLAALGAGWFIKTAAAVSSGLVFGGLVSFLIGTIRYWSNMHDYLRFGILGITLAALIWIGYKKINPVRKDGAC